MEKIYKRTTTTPRPGSLRANQERAEREEKHSPPFVAGSNTTPAALGERDDVCWAIAQELEEFFYNEGINSGKNAAWYFRRAQDAMDKCILRGAYKKHPERFRNGDGKQLTLADFGRNMVRYFRKNAPWGYCSNVEDVVSMFFDPVTLDDCIKGLWRVYKTRRMRKGIS